MNAEHKREYSKDGSIYITNERINTITHLSGTIFSILGAVILIEMSGVKRNPWAIVSFSIYGLSLISLFLASTFHHGIDSNKKTETLLKKIDYITIFPLIAGTFTPICLIIYRSIIGWSILGVIWGIAAAGISGKSIFPSIPKWVSNTVYISMSWIGIFLAGPVYNNTGIPGLSLLLAGGLFYTSGFTIYTIEKPNLIKGIFGFHEIWHILVILGALSHYLLMYLYILPLA